VLWNTFVSASESTKPILYYGYCMMLSREGELICDCGWRLPVTRICHRCGAEPSWMVDVRRATRAIEARRLEGRSNTEDQAASERD
jgi:hypothetical protein